MDLLFRPDAELVVEQLDLRDIEHAGLHPGDADGALHLVEVAAQQAQGHGSHQHPLHLIVRGAKGWGHMKGRIYLHENRSCNGRCDSMSHFNAVFDI